MNDPFASYVELHGAACPVCSERDLDRAPATITPEPLAGHLTVWVGCEACRSSWQEIYRLVDCTELSDAAGEPIDLSSLRSN